MITLDTTLGDLNLILRQHDLVLISAQNFPKGWMIEVRRKLKTFLSEYRPSFYEALDDAIIQAISLPVTSAITQETKFEIEEYDDTQYTKKLRKEIIHEKIHTPILGFRSVCGAVRASGRFVKPGEMVNCQRCIKHGTALRSARRQAAAKECAK